MFRAIQNSKQKLLQIHKFSLALSSNPQSNKIQHVCSPRCSLGDHFLDIDTTIISSQPSQSSIPIMIQEPGISRTFYKRDLPCPPAVSFSSEQGQLIFAEALATGTLQNFFPLIEQFRTQDEPAFCGLASISMVLNALSIDPRRAWKGPWRFFHEQMLDCCLPLEQVKKEGITLNQAACLARCNGADVVLYPHGSVTVEEFRSMVENACQSTDHHLIVSYSRPAFLQTGDGHFSPIGGYHRPNDMVLILDTARFKYPPHWVKLEELYHAMAAHDPTTGRPRGFMRMQLKPLLESVLFTLDMRHECSWATAYSYVQDHVSDLVKKKVYATSGTGVQGIGSMTAEELITAVAARAPFDDIMRFVSVRSVEKCGPKNACTQKSAVETLLHEVRGMPMYRAVHDALNELYTDSSISSATLHCAAQDGPMESGTDSGDVHPVVDADLHAERLTMLLLIAKEKIRKGVIAALDDMSAAAESSDTNNNGGSDTNYNDTTATTATTTNEDASNSWREKLLVLLHDLDVILDYNGAIYKVVDHEVHYLLDQYNELPAIQNSLCCGVCE